MRKNWKSWLNLIAGTTLKRWDSTLSSAATRVIAFRYIMWRIYDHYCPNELNINFKIRTRLSLRAKCPLLNAGSRRINTLKHTFFPQMSLHIFTFTRRKGSHYPKTRWIPKTKGIPKIKRKPLSSNGIGTNFFKNRYTPYTCINFSHQELPTSMEYMTHLALKESR